MKRGDVITVALRGDLGKPRPAVIIESDQISPTDFVLVCPGTSHMGEHSRNRRVLVLPTADNGLHVPTQFQADKISVVQRAKCHQVIGRLDDEAMLELSLRMMVVLGLVP